MRRRRWIENELVRQWRKAFGEPPTVMGDPHLMVELLRESQAGERAARSRREQKEGRA